MPSDGQHPMSLSCVSCRQRKVKCDKARPCSACQRSNVECVFPPRVRLPRGRQGGSRARNAEITRRLNRLEGLVERLGGEAVLTANVQSNEAAAKDSTALKASVEEDVGNGVSGVQSKESSESRDYEPIVQPDGSRYLSGDFWNTLSGEVDGLKSLLSQPSDDEDEYDNSSSSSSNKDKGSPETHFIFRSNTEIKDLRSLHPASAQMAMLCDIFFSRVDPLFKVVHRPTVKASILSAAEHRDSITSGDPQEALMFAIYFAAVTTLTSEECSRIFHLDRERLLIHYKYATETALSNADFLNTMELVTLQAFVIFLMCLRCHSESRSAWTLTSLAVRIGHALDLHRDDSSPGVSPFEAEMRRRLWWAINVLDTRASEDRGSTPMIAGTSTQKPSNVDDEDISPQSLQRVDEKLGGTEMTFSLISHEVSDAVRRLNYNPEQMDENKNLSSSQQEKEDLVRECNKRLESNYLSRCDTTIPIFWVASTVGRLTLLKMWLLLQYPIQPRQMNTRTTASKEHVLRAAVSILELTEMLETNESAIKWTWYFTTYVQWHPLAVTLAELCRQTNGPGADQAWLIVDTVFEKWSDRVADSKRGTLWRPIRKLHGKAKAARMQETSGLQSQAETPPDVPHWSDSTPRQAYVQPVIPENGNGPHPFTAVSHGPGPLNSEGPLLYSQQQVGLDGYIPADVISNMNLEQPIDPVNWGDWDEFVETTWRSGDPALDSGSMQWTPQFGL